MAIYNTFLIFLGMSFGFIASNTEVLIKEASVHEIQIAFKQNKLNSQRLVEFYLTQTESLNPLLRSVIEVNPEALFLADKADREQNAKSLVSLSSLLHGIPILLKDNIATKDKLNTTAGSYALLGSVVARDAGVVAKLRKAGAIVLWKASLTEWAAFRSSEVSGGWCARAGQVVMPICRIEYWVLILLMLWQLDKLQSTSHMVVRSLADAIAFNKKFSDLEKSGEYGQDLFLEVEKTNGMGELEKKALRNLTKASKNGLHKLMKENELDALVTPFHMVSHMFLKCSQFGASQELALRLYTITMGGLLVFVLED
ncbi:unnamed protein product [Camellia sinensis]